MQECRFDAYLSAVLSRGDRGLRTRPRRLAADHQDLPSDGYEVDAVARGPVWNAVPAALPGQASRRGVLLVPSVAARYQRALQSLRSPAALP